MPISTAHLFLTSHSFLIIDSRSVAVLCDVGIPRVGSFFGLALEAGAILPLILLGTSALADAAAPSAMGMAHSGSASGAPLMLHLHLDGHRLHLKLLHCPSHLPGQVLLRTKALAMPIGAQDSQRILWLFMVVS